MNQTKNRPVKIIWNKSTDYKECLELQKKIQKQSITQKTDFIIGQEHDLVITLGKRGNLQDIVSFDDSVPVFTIDRGGQATLHSPGQLVIYPIVNLRERGIGVRSFIEKLLFLTQKTLQELGVPTHLLSEGVGLKTSKGKIVFVGLRISQGMTSHGLSINISNDLELFQKIVPCGVQSQPLDRLINYLPLGSESFFRRWVIQFKEEFESPT